MNVEARYPANIFYSEEDEGYIATAPDLPGTSAFGETQEEALIELRHAISAWLEAARLAGNPVPEPGSAPSPSQASGKILLRLPRTLHGRLVESAKAEGTSLNQYLVFLLTFASTAKAYTSGNVIQAAAPSEGAADAHTYGLHHAGVTGVLVRGAGTSILQTGVGGSEGTSVFQAVGESGSTSVFQRTLGEIAFYNPHSNPSGPVVMGMPQIQWLPGGRIESTLSTSTAPSIDMSRGISPVIATMPRRAQSR